MVLTIGEGVVDDEYDGKGSSMIRVPAAGKWQTFFFLIGNYCVDGL